MASSALNQAGSEIVNLVQGRFLLQFFLSHSSISWLSQPSGSYLPQAVYVDTLWRQEQDLGDYTSIHLGSRDGEDKEPGDQADQAMDKTEKWETQEEPDVCADTPLGHRRGENDNE